MEDITIDDLREARPKPNITFGKVYRSSFVKRAPMPNTEKSYTQPDMTIEMATLLERAQNGMQVPSLDPVYYGDSHKELVNFENLTKQEKLDFVRKFKKVAQDNYEKLEATKLQEKEEELKQLLADKEELIKLKSQQSEKAL